MLYSHNHNDINPTVHIQMQIHNTYSNTNAGTGGLFCSDTNGFINFLNSAVRHEERDTILKSLSWSYYANNIPNGRCILWCLRSLSVEIRKTQLHLERAKSNSQLNGKELNSLPQWQKLNCLPAWPNLKSSTALSNINFSTPWSDLN